MTQPPQTAVSFYKIAPSQTVTFGWNFTSLYKTPTSLTLSAICDNGNTYPVGPTDGALPGTATEVLWDVEAWQVGNPQLPLAQGTCTLTMWDERGKTALPKPGLMQPFSSLQFGFYTPQPYTALADGEFIYAFKPHSTRTSGLHLRLGWTCPECRNGSVLSATVHPAFIGFIVSFLVIFLSGFHLFRSNSH